MFDHEIYDPILEELWSISETMKELEMLISQQKNIENANNLLLRKLLENPHYSFIHGKFLGNQN